MTAESLQQHCSTELCYSGSVLYLHCPSTVTTSHMWLLNFQLKPYVASGYLTLSLSHTADPQKRRLKI